MALALSSSLVGCMAPKAIDSQAQPPGTVDRFDSLFVPWPIDPRSDVLLREAGTRYVAELSRALANDVPLSYARGVSTGPLPSAAGGPLFKTGIELHSASHPLDRLGAPAFAPRHLPPELRAEDLTLPVAPFFLRAVGRYPGTQVQKFELLETLPGDSRQPHGCRVLWEGDVSAGFDDQLNSRSAAAIATAIDAREDEVKAAIGALLPDDFHKPLITLKPCPGAATFWAAMKNQEITFSFAFNDPGAPRSETLSFLLESEVLRTLGNQGIEIRVQPDLFSLEKTITVDGLQPGATEILGKPLQLEIKDQFGNPLRVSHTQFLSPAELVWVTLSIDLSSVNGPAGLHLRPFDGSPIGLPKSCSVFWVQIDPPLAEIGPYRILGDRANSLLESLSDVLPELATIAEKIECLFGYPPGTKITEIAIENCNTRNGFFDPRHPTRITIHDENLQSPAAASATIAHEAFHLIDLARETPLTSGALEALFLDISKNNPLFLHAINEKYFLRSVLEISYAGHAEDNVFELWASFLNGNFGTNWEEIIKTYDPEKILKGEPDQSALPDGQISREAFIKDYLRTLEAIATVLKDCPDITSEAPIHRLLRQRTDFIKALTNSGA